MCFSHSLTLKNQIVVAVLVFVLLSSLLSTALNAGLANANPIEPSIVKIKRTIKSDVNLVDSTVPDINMEKTRVTIITPENKTYRAANVPLTFAVFSGGDPFGKFVYSLDHQANITVLGNTTLEGLSNGEHHVAVYAEQIGIDISKGIQPIYYFSPEAYSETHFIINCPPQVQGSWTINAPMPYTIEAFSSGAAVLDGKIYVVAAHTEMYNPSTDTWTEKKPIWISWGSIDALAACQSKIYAISQYQYFYSNNQVYDPATDTWETKALMPTATYHMQANVVDGKIYVIGGMGVKYSPNNIQILQTNEVYDPASDSWSEMAPLPTAVAGYASAVLDNKIYIIGGYNKLNYQAPPSMVNLVQIFDPKTNQWTQGTPIPNPIYGMVACATAGVQAPKRIYVIGGRNSIDSRPVDWTQIYNPQTNSWSSGTSMPTERWGLSLVNVNDKLYALGGAVNNSLHDDTTANEVFTPADHGLVAPSLTPTVASKTETPSPTLALTSAPSFSLTPPPTQQLTPSPSDLASPTPNEPSSPLVTYLVAVPIVAIVMSAAVLAVILLRRKHKKILLSYRFFDTTNLYKKAYNQKIDKNYVGPNE